MELLRGGLGANVPSALVSQPTLGNEIRGGKRVALLVEQDGKAVLLAGARGTQDPIGSVLVVVQAGVVGSVSEMEREGLIVAGEGLVKLLVGGLKRGQQSCTAGSRREWPGALLPANPAQ